MEKTSKRQETKDLRNIFNKNEILLNFVCDDGVLYLALGDLF